MTSDIAQDTSSAASHFASARDLSRTVYVATDGLIPASNDFSSQSQQRSACP